MCRAAQLQQTRRHHPLPRTLSFRRQRSLICVHSCPDRVQTALLARTVLRCARRGPAGGHPGWRAPGARRTAWHAQRGRCLLPAPTRGRCRGATAWRAPSLAAPACRATRPRSWSQRSRRPAPADPINHVPGLADASMARRTRGARQHVARMLALVSCPSSPLIFIAECCWSLLQRVRARSFGGYHSTTHRAGQMQQRSCIAAEQAWNPALRIRPMSFFL